MKNDGREPHVNGPPRAGILPSVEGVSSPFRCSTQRNPGAENPGKQNGATREGAQSAGGVRPVDSGSADAPDSRVREHHVNGETSVAPLDRFSARALLCVATCTRGAL